MEILKAAENGLKKTHMMYKARLSFFQLESCLTALKKAGFITEEFDIWKTTEKGLHVIEACKICSQLLGADSLDRRITKDSHVFLARAGKGT